MQPGMVRGNGRSLEASKNIWGDADGHVSHADVSAGASQTCMFTEPVYFRCVFTQRP